MALSPILRRNLPLDSGLTGVHRAVSTATSANESPSPSLSMETMVAMGGGRKLRESGDIGSSFTSLAGVASEALPERFAELKREIMGDTANRERLVSSWRNLTARLAQLAPEIERKQQACIPVLTYDELLSGSPETIARVKECGTAVVTDVVPEREATRWLSEVRDYIAANPQVTGFPANDKQVFEIYWTKPQLEARAHFRSMQVQKALLSLFSSDAVASASDDGAVPAISSSTSLTYCDRLRIRNPGDAQFALGPHMDGGSIERWEDPTYRSVYWRILSGQWDTFDAWEFDARALANQNMYNGAGACAVFRAFQGWTSLSHTGPGQGTLRVYPYIREMTAYTLLRPLFKAKVPRDALPHADYLAADNWELDIETSAFPNSPTGRGQEMNDETHPHLQLARTMVSLPHVRPGDQAWWHADVIHAVEPRHGGTGPSAVMYIPSVPLTPQNVAYVRDQRASFIQRTPPPDFPSGTGESSFVGTGTPSDIRGHTARQAMGLEPFEITDDLLPNERAARQSANVALGF